MANVCTDISASLDEFVNGPNPEREHGLGRGRATAFLGHGQRARRGRERPARARMALRWIVWFSQRAQ